MSLSKGPQKHIKTTALSVPCHFAPFIELVIIDVRIETIFSSWPRTGPGEPSMPFLFFEMKPMIERKNPSIASLLT